MPFQINSVQPPEGARPLGDGYMLHIPTARGRNGEDEPIGACGLPWLEITFEKLDATGWNWWVAQVGVGNLHADKTNIETWNPWKSGGAGWTTYSTGKLHMPEPPDAITQAYYKGVRILITALVE